MSASQLEDTLQAVDFGVLARERELKPGLQLLVFFALQLKPDSNKALRKSAQFPFALEQTWGSRAVLAQRCVSHAQTGNPVQAW